MATLLTPERNQTVAPQGAATNTREPNEMSPSQRFHAPAHRLAAVLLLCIDSIAVLVAVAVAGFELLGLAYAGAALMTLAGSHAYQLQITLRAVDEMPWLIARLAIPLVLLAPVAVLTGGAGELLTVGLLGVVVAVFGRAISFGMLRLLRRDGVLLEPAVIIGAGEIGAEIARVLREHREYGIAPIGFVDSVSGNLPLPVLGDVDELHQIINRYRIRRVIVAFGHAREAELVKVLRDAVQDDIEIHVVPRFFECGIAPEGPDTDDIWGIPLYRVHCAAMRAPTWMLKRVLDVVVVTAILVLGAPVLGVVALAVRLTSRGPILFRQRRVGQCGREIEVLKFRTLRHNEDSDTQWSVIGDERLTPIGRFLRRTGLDELPQLWSVARGDMSLVGPRPERPFFVRRFSTDVDGYEDRHRVPVGVTGWAQVHGLRGDTSIEERARFDNQYIEHWSMWRDIVVLCRTAAELARGVRGPDR